VHKILRCAVEESDYACYTRYFVSISLRLATP
jgi:hypothetical protein